MKQRCRCAWPLAGLLVMLCMVTSACDIPSRAISARMSLRSPTPTLGHVTRFTLPAGVPVPHRIIAGPDGALWFTAFNVAPVPGMVSGRPVDDAIVRMTQAGAFAVFRLPSPSVYPDGIAVGPDGNLWFTEFYGDAVGRITSQGRITEFLVPPRPNRATGSLPGSQPHAIVTGPDGNLWFNDFGGNKIGRITPSGALREFSLPSHPENPNGSGPYSVALGPDGAIWFTELMGMRIGRSTLGGHITEFRLPGINHVPSDIVASSDGALWFSESTQNLLGRITPDGHITEYPLPHAPCDTAGVSGPSAVGVCQIGDLVAGPDGGIWFSEPWRYALAHIDGQGHFTEFPVPGLFATTGGPVALAVGPDGALWFTYGKGIGRFSL